MKTLTFITQKGGAGKTTLAASLAVTAAQNRHKVIALDLDPQGSLMAWAERRAEDTPLPSQLTVERIRPEQLPRLKALLDGLATRGFEVAILDTAGVDTPATHLAIEAADLCLVPAQPSLIDLAATVPTFKAIHRLNKDAAFILNRCPTHKNASRTVEAATALATLGHYAQPAITARADHQDAIAAGLGVTEYAPESKAAEETRALWQWIQKNTKGAR